MNDALALLRRARVEGFDHEEFPHQCHAASLAIVRMTGEGRVARGGCVGVPGQHSWVVVGDDCYDRRAQILDATLWSYDGSIHGVWTGTAQKGLHTPHGAGSIWQWGRPDDPVGPVLELEPPEGGWSSMTSRFLELLGPLDLNGWVQLAHAPVEGWPSKEIYTAMYHDERLGGRIPIDIVGMVTDINPSGLYLPEGKSHAA